MEVLHLLDKEGRCAGGKPIVLQQTIAKGVKQAEGIEDRCSTTGKTVAVVFELDLSIHLLRGQLEVLGHSLNVFLENRLHLLLRKAADGSKTGEQGDILQIVDSGEDAQLRELRDAGDEAELYVGLVGLERHVELLHDLAHGVERGLVVKHIQQGCVVFVDDDSHLLACLFLRAMDEAGEQFARRSLVVLAAIDFGQRFHHPHQCLTQVFGTVLPFSHAQIEMDDRIVRPFPFDRHDLQPLKQLTVALEIRIQSRCEQRLAEAAWTIHKYERGIVCQLPHKVGLVNIQIALPYNL